MIRSKRSLLFKTYLPLVLIFLLSVARLATLPVASAGCVCHAPPSTGPTDPGDPPKPDQGSHPECAPCFQACGGGNPQMDEFCRNQCARECGLPID